jgi:hypothetical protein
LQKIMRREAAMMLWNRVVLSSCAALLTLAQAAAQPAAAPARNGQCFTSNQFENWRAADARTIIIRVRGNHYYRLDLGGQCTGLMTPNPRLITRFRGSNMVCSGLDWDLKVSAGLNEPAEPCLVRTMTELSPAEVSALPPKAKP